MNNQVNPEQARVQNKKSSQKLYGKKIKDTKFDPIPLEIKQLLPNLPSHLVFNKTNELKQS